MMHPVSCVVAVVPASWRRILGTLMHVQSTLRWPGWRDCTTYQHTACQLDADTGSASLRLDKSLPIPLRSTISISVDVVKEMKLNLSVKGVRVGPDRNEVSIGEIRHRLVDFRASQLC